MIGALKSNNECNALFIQATRLGVQLDIAHFNLIVAALDRFSNTLYPSLPSVFTVS